MKKIVSLLLALVLALTALTALAACSGLPSSESDSHIRNLNMMFESLVPTQTVTTTTQKTGALVLTSVATLTVGTVDGNRAATYINEYEELAPLDGGMNSNLVIPKTEKLWYVEGKGICKNGSENTDEDDWIKDGADFSPKAGDIKLTLKSSMFATSEYNEETETFTATLDSTNASALLSEFLKEDQKIESELTLVINTAGGRVTKIRLEYTQPERSINVVVDQATNKTEVIKVPMSLITIEVHYSYDAKVITLN